MQHCTSQFVSGRITHGSTDHDVLHVDPGVEVKDGSHKPRDRRRCLPTDCGGPDNRGPDVRVFAAEGLEKHGHCGIGGGQNRIDAAPHSTRSWEDRDRPRACG